MKNILLLMGIVLFSNTSAQILSNEQKQEIIMQLKKELLDSLQNHAVVENNNNTNDNPIINKQKENHLKA